MGQCARRYGSSASRRCGAGPLVAQSAGTISGAVLDQLAKSIPGAKVTAKSESGSVSGTATTDGDGHFTIGGLAAGTYSVETTSPGFALNTRRGVQVSASGTQESRSP